MGGGVLFGVDSGNDGRVRGRTGGGWGLAGGGRGGVLGQRGASYRGDGADSVANRSPRGAYAVLEQ